MKWDVTGAFSHVGEYQVMFVYTGGKNGLKVKNVGLEVEGKVEWSDKHEGTAFEPSVNNTWEVTTNQAVKKMPVRVVADVKGDDGVDSNGEVLVYAKGTFHKP
jgi:hypothetical protein